VVVLKELIKYTTINDRAHRRVKELGISWSRTVVAVVTEFGRTVAVNGGCVIADWPGLSGSDLYQNRDLKPTADLRSLFKGVLAEHLSLSDALLNTTVFPGSNKVRPMQNLVRS